IEAFIARSYDGGFNFTNELVSSEQSPTNIPGSNVRFGDYIDIDYQGSNTVPVWTDERAGGFNMDIYTAEISEILGIDPITKINPDKFELLQNYPNPFNPSTAIIFSAPKISNIKIKIFNVLGEEIKTLVDGSFEKGVHTVQWNASGLNSGVYFYTLTAEEYTDTKKMILIK
ncbi:MAG: T9SS type A sorting domain-containing protein, partial [Ignavibacteria bacterium]